MKGIQVGEPNRLMSFHYLSLIWVLHC